MTLRTTSSLLAFAMVAAFSGAAQAQPTEQQLSANDDQALQQIIDWVGDEPERIQAAMEHLGIDEPTEIDEVSDPLAGTYKLKSGFGSPKITLTVLPNGDGTYSVQRVHERRKGTSSLLGEGTLGKETITGKTRLLVDFSPSMGGAVGALEAMESQNSSGENPNAIYKIDAEIGRISGTFFENTERDLDDDVNTGSYESGWRVGAAKVSFANRFKRSAKIMAGKVKVKLGLVKDKLVSMAQDWKATGLKVKAKLVEFGHAVAAKAKQIAAKTKEIAIKAGTSVKNGTKRGWEATKKGTKRGWEATKRTGHRVGDAVRTGTANVMDASGDVLESSGRALHRRAERVRPE